MRNEVMALTAQGRASGWILAALPIALGGLLSFVNPGYLAPLFGDPIGRMAIAGALVLEFVGFFAIQRIVDIEV
jgi:tight adherence protein B